MDLLDQLDDLFFQDTDLFSGSLIKGQQAVQFRIKVSTGAYEEDIIYSGTAVMNLFCSSDAPSTDLVARITKVDEQGRSVKIGMCVQNLCLRYGTERRVPLEKDTIYPVTMETANFCVLIRRGERLRLSVTSSAQKLIYPNPNTLDSFSSEEMRTAVNTVWFGSGHASCIRMMKTVTPR